MRRRRTNQPTLELLEARQLLAADGAELVPDAFVVRQNSRDHQFDLLANDKFDDDYAGVKRITGISLGSSGGRLRIADDGSFVHYDAPADVEGVERFTYFVDGEFSAEVVIEINAPLQADEFELHPDRATYTLPVLANDPFWNDYTGNRQITLVSASSRAAAVQISEDGRSLIYTRQEHTYGGDVLTYIVDDIYPASVAIDIEAPLLSDRFQLEQFDPARSYNVVRNDPFWSGYAGARTVTHILDAPEGVSATIDADGKSIRFDPLQAAPGSYNLRYVVDSEFETSVTFHVERPVRDDSATVDKNSSDFRINVLQNDYYYQLGNFRHRIYSIDRITSVGETEQGGDVKISAGGQSILYSPPADFVGTDTFEYVGDGLHVATVNVFVRNPVGENVNRNDHFTIYQGTANNRLDVLSNDFFGNGYTGDRIITAVTPVEGATVVIEEGGKRLLFTPHDDGRHYSFQYTVDGSLEGEVSVHARSVATHENFRFDSRETRTLRIVDRLGIPSNYTGAGVITAVTQPENGGSAAISADGRSVIVDTGMGPGSFQYTLDDKYTASISTRYNQRLSSDYVVVHQNSGTSEHDVLANDFNAHTNRLYGPYRGPRRITEAESSAGGTVTVAADGKSILFTPEEDFVGSVALSYVVDDFLQTNVSIDVARLLRHDTVRVAPDSEGESLNLLGNDLAGGDYRGPLEITSVSAGSAGAQISIAADGKSVFYVPATNFQGTDVFEYTVDDQLKANVTVEVSADPAALYPKFSTLDQFKQLVLQSARNSGGGFGGGLSNGLEDAFDSSAPSSRDHSETNVQVAGVDEADLIETDPDYLYTLTHGQLVITKAWPADELEVVSRTEIKGNAIGQYLYEDRLTVISEEFQHFFFDDFSRGGGPDIAFDGFSDAIWPFPIGDPTTYVTVLDVSDRANPKLVQRTEIEGSHVQTRRIDDFVYLVVRDSQSLVPQREYLCEGEEGAQTCRYETDEEYFHRIDTEFPSVVEELLPNYDSYGPDGKLVRSGLLIEPEDIFDPISPGASSLVTVAAINVTSTEPGIAASSGVLTTGASQLYVTAKDIYVFENHYSWNDDTLSDSPTTKILRFQLDSSSGGVNFISSGQVPGQILNQFSADEYDGHLRVATMIWNSRTGNYSGATENALFVMRDDAGVLEIVGTLQNLALNETIQSVRYFGDRALVTTFREIDPLFSVDLSDPTNPHVEGYLTLPGRLTYLQEVGENKFLTIGRSTGIGGSGVVMVSLFDVSNILQPRLIDQFNWGSFSRSVAETDHHAFGWFANHDTLAIPSQVNYTTRTDEDEDGYKEHVNHVREYKLHAFGIDASHTTRNDGAIEVNGTVQMDSPLLRSAYIDDKLYAVATDSIKSTQIATPGLAIDEVDISRPEGEERPDPVADPRLLAVAALGRDAKRDLANSADVSAGEVMLVSSESDEDSTRLLLRLGQEHFVYHGLGDQLELERSDFRPNSVGAPFDWHNESNPRDTTGDGFVTARDALVIINMINGGMVGGLPTTTVVNQIATVSDEFKVDVNGDGEVTSRDVLSIVNFLNRQSAQGTAEPSANIATDAYFAALPDPDFDEDEPFFLS